MAKAMSDRDLVEGLNIVLRELDVRRELKRDIPSQIISELTTYFEDEIANVEQGKY